jgi:hypothetical protein
MFNTVILSDKNELFVIVTKFYNLYIVFEQSLFSFGLPKTDSFLI